MFIVNKPSITDFVIEFRGERERNRKIDKERKRERELPSICRWRSWPSIKNRCGPTPCRPRKIMTNTITA